MPYPVSAVRSKGSIASSAFSPLSLSPALWLDASVGLYKDTAGTTPATADGDAVALWKDQSGNGYDVSQATAGQRPLLKLGANGINSNPTVLFDGSNDLLVRTVANWLSSNDTGSLYIVMKTGASVTGAMLGSFDEGTGATNGIAFGVNINVTARWDLFQYFNNPYDEVKGNTVIATSTAYLIQFDSNGTVYSGRVNGTNQSMITVNGSNTGDWFADCGTLRDNFSIGAMKYNAEAFFFTGSIAEVQLYNTQLTGVNATNVENYLNNKYACF